MKVGDKIYCIKSRKKHTTIGKFYKIREIYKDYIEILSDYNEPSFYKITIDDNYYLLENHFITKQELRKQKLKKINEHV